MWLQAFNMNQYFLPIVIASVLLDQGFCDTNYRLNIDLRPISYYITITPYFDTGDDRAFTFDGEVSVHFRTYADGIRQIKIHSEDLAYNQSDVILTTVDNNQPIELETANALEFDTNYSFAYINLQQTLTNNSIYVLNVTYSGRMRTDLHGFYQSNYIENGVKKWLGATQIGLTQARNVFPCFDEPEYKATFHINIDRPENYKPSLSNMAIRATQNLTNGYIRESFYPTPVMSTYLVAFLVSELEAAAVNTTNLQEFGIYTRPEAVNQSAYAFDIGQRSEIALSDYFGINYYSINEHLQLKHLALHDFSYGAMENWGVIKYRESALLYVPEESSPDYKYRAAQIIAHETVHMWFGNLVSCHWWSDAWLSEGFATYFQDYITSLIEPDVGSANILVTGSVYSAYDADDTANALPISNPNVYSRSEINAQFSTITYQKAGTIIRMIHNILGDTVFRRGLQNYLNKKKFDVAHPSDLYKALEESIEADNPTDYTRFLTITDIMESWINQPGHPIVNVNVDYTDGKITLSQKRFYAESTMESNETYYIPITYTTGLAPDFENTEPQLVMTNITHEFEISQLSQNHAWIVFNIQETGFYRVNYDVHSWEIISNALKGNNRNQIHHLNRAKVINDLFAFLYAEEVNFETLHNVLEFLKEETDYSVWFAAIRGFNRLINSFSGNDMLQELVVYFLDIMDNIINKLGYEANDNDDIETQRNRMQILNFACKFGHKKCIEESIALFKAAKENQLVIPVGLRPLTYCNGLRYGDEEDYDYLWNRLATSNVANDARNIIGALACTRNKNKLESYLLSVSDEGPIRIQDATLPLASALSHYENVRVVIESLKQNYALWSSSHYSMNSVMSSVASALRSTEDFDSFTEFLDGCVPCDAQMVNSALAALERAKKAVAWADSHEASIAKVLRDDNHATLTAASSMLLIVLMLTLI